jgi:hypothetical protein
MKNISIIRSYRLLALISLFMVLTVKTLMAQEDPPKPVSVNVTGQNLSFGAFSHGASGGTVTISSTGSRTATGQVVLLNLGYSFSTALFEIVANPGTVISILNGSDVALSGSNGGSMNLHLGDSDPISPFVVPDTPSPMNLNVGGTLTVGNALSNPPGSYSGTFDIVFIQE